MIHIVIVIGILTIVVTFLSYYHDLISKVLCQKKFDKEGVKSVVFKSKLDKYKSKKEYLKHDHDEYGKDHEEDHYGKDHKYDYDSGYGDYGHHDYEVSDKYGVYGKSEYPTKVYKSSKGCVEPKHVFCNTEPCKDKSKCGEICAVKCTGPYINENCVPCPNLSTEITSVISGLECMKEKVVEQFVKGQCFKSLKYKDAYFHELKKFVDLFDAIRLDDHGKKILLCHLERMEKSFFKWINNLVQRKTARFKCKEDMEEWLKKNDLEKQKIKINLVSGTDDLARALHKILPTLGSYESIKEYFAESGHKLVRIALLELDCENDNSKSILKLMDERQKLREEFAEKLALAMACTTCNG